MRVNIKDIVSNADCGILCKTKEQSDNLCEWLHVNGYNWFSGNSYIESTLWCDSKIGMIYFPSSGTWEFGSFIPLNETIVDFNDVNFDDKEYYKWIMYDETELLEDNVYLTLDYYNDIDTSYYCSRTRNNWKDVLMYMRIKKPDDIRKIRYDKLVQDYAYCGNNPIYKRFFIKLNDVYELEIVEVYGNDENESGVFFSSKKDAIEFMRSVSERDLLKYMFGI